MKFFELLRIRLSLLNLFLLDFNYYNCYLNENVHISYGFLLFLFLLLLLKFFQYHHPILLTFIYLLSTLNEDSKVRYRLFFLLLVYAVFMESIQHTVQQSREFELADMISNISGIVSAYCICHLIRCFK